MRQSDPFPIPYQGLEPSQTLDWAGMAKRIVHDSLKLERHERVILSANPYCGGAMLDAIRVEIQRADAIELATILHWTPDIAPLRGPGGCKTDPESEQREDDAMRAMFAVADVFIWLQNDWRPSHATHAIGQSEKVLDDWPGRSVHFHWFHDPNDPDPDSAANKALDLVYQSAVLDLDYAALRRTMDNLVAKTRGKTVRVTDPAGTDLSFRMTDRFCLNDGDASRAAMADARNARDREEEIPGGALRTIPDQDSASGVMAFDADPGYPVLGYGLDFRPFMGCRPAHPFPGWANHPTADRWRPGRTRPPLGRTDRRSSDRLGEFVLGCNPLLTEVPGSNFLPYCGFGDGVLRLTIGENVESGGTNESSLHRWMMFRNATISVDDEELVADGRLTPAGTGG